MEKCNYNFNQHVPGFSLMIELSTQFLWLPHKTDWHQNSSIIIMTICSSTCWVLEYYRRRHRPANQPPVSNYSNNGPQNVTEIMIYSDAKLASGKLIAMIWQMLYILLTTDLNQMYSRSFHILLTTHSSLVAAKNSENSN